ncbi:hypothetical protein BDFB_012407 [Asbolus verrucosus]|uniref:DDE 3 domain containing protein n=1 Tax=Asbolus verrucosus TaxID=1661398 RepID=A0A482VE76_ASBVE|nr:hypothetical protein BDFB_012407 [Asbolus verrucosus]
MFSDEAKFYNNGAVNRHNCHYYALENLRWIRESHFQQVVSINVWCGIIDNYIVGLYFFQNNLTDARYLHFLQKDLLLLLENVPLDIRQKMWLQHDGAPPYYTRNVDERCSVNAWSPRNPLRLLFVGNP